MIKWDKFTIGGPRISIEWALSLPLVTALVYRTSHDGLYTFTPCGFAVLLCLLSVPVPHL